MTGQLKRSLWILAGAMLLTTGLTEGLMAQGGEWKAPRRSARKRNPLRNDSSAIVAGRAIYLKSCVTCHGSTGRGDGPAAAALNPKPKDLTARHVDKQKDGELYWKIQNGKAPMPAFGGTLKRKQIWQVVSYIRSLKSSPAAVTPQPVKDPKASVTELLDQYFGLQTRLKAGAWSPKARAGSGKLAQKVASLGDLIGGDKKQKALWRSNRDAIAKGVKRLGSAKDLDYLAAFDQITRALDSMVSVFGHAEGDAVSLFICKMGKGKAGNVWLQKGSKAMNPFPWGAKMPNCGEELKSYTRTKTATGTSPR